MGNVGIKKEDVLIIKRQLWAATRGVLQVSALALAILTISVAFASYYYGSFSAALGYLKGDRLIVAERFKSIGEVSSGSEHLVSFSLCNYSGRPVRILGVRASCSCTSIEDLPKVLRAGQTLTVPVKVDTPRSGTDFFGNILIFTDYSEQTVIILELHARLIAPKAF